MKTIKIASVLLLLISIFIFGAYKVYEYKNKDTQPPMIQCETEELVVSVETSEEELLQGVTALDDQSGDVTSTLVIESISPFTEEDARIITYAAIDAKGNVGRCERVLKYEDYQGPTFALSEPLRFPIGKSVNLLGVISAKSPLDGDLSDNIKYTLDETINLSKPGTYHVEFRVTDSCGYVAYFPLEVEIYDKSEERIEVVLSDYSIQLPLNEAFDPTAYYVGSDIEGELTVKSTVDNKTPGIYYVDYIVNGNNGMGKSRLVVVVTES